MKYLQFNDKIEELKKGLPEGYCRICGKWKKLSVDHVPPKACGNINRIEIIYNNGKLISQNGLNCKTICEHCNNTLLGGNYDKSIINLYLNVMKLSQKKVPTVKDFMINTRSLVRCLLGHYIAMSVYDKELSVQEILLKPLEDKDKIIPLYRKFVLGETDVLDNTECYYWYYPYNEIKLFPSFSKTNVIDRPSTIYGTLIKFFPIALYLVDTRNSTHSYKYIPSINFDINRLTLNFRNILPNDFPQMPASGEIILLNAGSSFDVKNIKK